MVELPAAGVSLGLAVAFTLFVWWSSTGIILYLDGLPRATYRVSFSIASGVTACALYGIVVTAQQSDLTSIYVAFACSLMVWGWVEMAFLMGYIVGPRQSPCPPDAQGWRRASAAISAILYHELALLTGIALLAALTWDAPNRLALWTFVVLWVSRESTKLNLFFGARNFNEQFLPPRLRYIATYFRRRPMNLLFPFAVSASTFAATCLWQLAASAGTEPEVVASALLASLVTLGTLEHWFLVLPIRSEKLWEWSQGLRADRSAPLTETSAHDPGLP